MSARDVIANLRALAARTSDAHGAQRVAWGPVWRDARAWLGDLLAEEGLRAEPDLAGNGWITVPGKRPAAGTVGEPCGDTTVLDAERTTAHDPRRMA